MPFQIFLNFPRAPLNRSPFLTSNPSPALYPAQAPVFVLPPVHVIVPLDSLDPHAKPVPRDSLDPHANLVPVDVGHAIRVFPAQAGV